MGMIQKIILRLLLLKKHHKRSFLELKELDTFIMAPIGRTFEKNVWIIGIFLYNLYIDRMVANE